MSTSTEVNAVEIAAARMTHLRDEKKALESAIYNTYEEVMEDIQLALAALERPEPKVTNAVHRIELVMEAMKSLRSSASK